MLLKSNFSDVLDSTNPNNQRLLSLTSLFDYKLRRMETPLINEWLVNPIYYLLNKEIDNAHLLLPWGNLHGDLHQDNIIASDIG